MVDGVKRVRLHKGRRLRAMGSGGEERRVRPRWGGVEKLWLALYSSLPHASVESLQKESYGGKKKIFPTTSGKYPGRGGKKLIFFSWTIVLGTVVSSWWFCAKRYDTCQRLLVVTIRSIYGSIEFLRKNNIST